jgi:hypothetical protein
LLPSRYNQSFPPASGTSFNGRTADSDSAYWGSNPYVPANSSAQGAPVLRGFTTHAEVGIRVALGGQPRHVAVAMFRAPTTNIGLGILIGLVLAIGISGGNGVGLVLMYGSVILAISSLATLGPVRRALRIQPTEALRAE